MGSLLFQIDNNINNKHIGDNDNTFISSHCFGCSDRNLAQTSLRRKADLLAQQVQSQLGPGFYFFSSQMALPTGKHEDHWQIKIGDYSSWHNSTDSGNVHRARGLGLGR